MHTAQNKQNRQGEEKQEYNKTILTQEIDSWSNYEYALREENRLVFE